MPETFFERLERQMAEGEEAKESQLAATLANVRELGLEIVLNENLPLVAIRLEVGQAIWDRLMKMEGWDSTLQEDDKPGFDLKETD